jgi:hypothetical protein
MTAGSWKPSERTLRVRVPSGQGWPPAGSESWTVGVTEAVKRRQRDRRLCGELRNHPLWTPTLYVEWEGNTTGAELAWHRGSTGVIEAGHVIEGPPGTWEAPPSPWSRACGAGEKLNAVDPREVMRPPSREMRKGAPRYRRARQRACRDGWWGVGATHSTEEAGEPSSKGPGGGKGSPGKRN